MSGYPEPPPPALNLFCQPPPCFSNPQHLVCVFFRDPPPCFSNLLKSVEAAPMSKPTPPWHEGAHRVCEQIYPLRTRKVGVT